MFWEQVQKLPDKRFKRATGVHKEIFVQMLEVVTTYKMTHRKHPTRGKPPKLSWADKILMMLMYYREYRTMEHIGITYSVSESRVCEIIREMESILIRDQRFHLPGKKNLLQAGNNIEVVLIDVTESPVERPKKNSDGIIRARKRNTPLKRK
jgi:hypothetical protein